MLDQIIILAAGKGTRLSYESLPKVLVPFRGQPLIRHLLLRIGRIIQSTRPIVVVGFMAEKVKAALGNRFDYVLQEPQLGTAHAVRAAQKSVRAENVLVLYGDMPFITEESLRKLIRMHHDEKANLSMLITTVPNFENEFAGFSHYGRVIRSFNREIVKITEYKDASNAEKNIRELNTGIYMFDSQWLWKNIKRIKNQNAQREYYLTDIVEIAIREKEKIYSLAIEPREIIGINSMEDLKAAERMV